MSFVYFLSKFSTEVMLVELFLISLLCVCYFGYLLFQKRRYGAAKNQIPDHIIRAYLVDLIGNAESFKNQLFGTDFKIPTSGFNVGPTVNAAMANAQAAAPVAAPAAATSGASSAELEALKAQLGATAGKQDELTKAIATLTAEKAALEQKLAAAPAAAAGGGDTKALQDKIAKLESKLTEYEVIEDDLANLKKYQQENKQLRAQLEAQKGGAPAPVAAAAPATPTPEVAAAAPVAPEPVAAAPAAPEVAAAEPAAPAAAAPAPTPTPIAAAETTISNATAAASFEGLVDKVEESIAKPTGASASDPVAALQAQTAPTVTEAAPAAATEVPKVEKTDADLLSEFERMLNS